MKHICFLMPGTGYNPIGGHKVVYEYANRFCNNNYKVSIIYPASLHWKKQSFKNKIVQIMWYFQNKLPYRSPYHWFNLNKKIALYNVWSLEEHNVPKADIYIATAIKTAMYLNDYKIAPNQKIYFIQDYENWSMPDEEVRATYQYPMRKVTISNWLHSIISGVNAECDLVHNGFDFNYFQLTIPIYQKNKYRLTMMYNPGKRKGCVYGLKALDIVKKEIPQLQVTLFSTFPRPSFLPDWYTYFRCPDRNTHNRINNEASIYLASSNVEGWGLTVGEAMQCGQAVVCTDNLGYREMAVHNETALVSPIKDSVQLAENIILLIRDDELRQRIATNANLFIQKFTWERAFYKMKEIIDNNNYLTNSCIQ